MRKLHGYLYLELAPPRRMLLTYPTRLSRSGREAADATPLVIDMG